MGCGLPMNIYDADVEGQVFMSQYFKYIFRFTTSYEKKVPLTSNSIEILKKKKSRDMYWQLYSCTIIWKIFPSFIHSSHIGLGSI